MGSWFRVNGAKFYKGIKTRILLQWCRWGIMIKIRDGEVKNGTTFGPGGRRKNYKVCAKIYPLVVLLWWGGPNTSEYI